MNNFTSLSSTFEKKFSMVQFPEQPESLYDGCRYMLSLGGKRIRPVCVLMGNELFGELNEDAFHAAIAVELFHNFSLVHDDIMDKAPLRRGMSTVHTKYNESTALLCGDVMLVAAYDYLEKISTHFHPIMALFNKTAKEVCEGQQMDMNFENENDVNIEAYEKMITLKTSVLLAASLQFGAIIGGAGLGNQHHLYEFGKNLGMAFQVQDDYLDAFGDPDKFGKLPGGDILANKKTFLMIHALDIASDAQKKKLKSICASSDDNKVSKVLAFFRECGVDSWAQQLKDAYFTKALKHLDEIAVLSSRKTELRYFAQYLLNRDK